MTRRRPRCEERLFTGSVIVCSIYLKLLGQTTRWAVEPLPQGNELQIWQPRSGTPLGAADDGRHFSFYFSAASKEAELRHSRNTRLNGQPLRGNVMKMAAMARPKTVQNLCRKSHRVLIRTNKEIHHEETSGSESVLETSVIALMSIRGLRFLQTSMFRLR
jgi:hypothetical protein